MQNRLVSPVCVLEHHPHYWIISLKICRFLRYRNAFLGFAHWEGGTHANRLRHGDQNIRQCLQAAGFELQFTRARRQVDWE
jgi:hypothetical protein